MTFTCPRCEGSADGEFYGPCGRCRDSLRAAYAGQARDVATEAYEPKVNVTPNQVATKD